MPPTDQGSGSDRKMPYLWISSRPLRETPYQCLQIGPSKNSVAIQVKQIAWREGAELTIHPRMFSRKCWVVVREPSYDALRCFHTLPWPNRVRAALDKESVDMVVDAFPEVINQRVKLDRFSPFVSLDNASLAAGFSSSLTLSKEVVRQRAPSLAGLLDGSRTGLSLVAPPSGPPEDANTTSNQEDQAPPDGSGSVVPLAVGESDDSGIFTQLVLSPPVPAQTTMAQWDTLPALFQHATLDNGSQSESRGEESVHPEVD